MTTKYPWIIGKFFDIDPTKEKAKHEEMTHEVNEEKDVDNDDNLENLYVMSKNHYVWDLWKAKDDGGIVLSYNVEWVDFIKKHPQT